LTETLTLKDVRAEQVAQLKNDIAAAEALKNPAADAQTAA